MRRSTSTRSGLRSLAYFSASSSFETASAAQFRSEKARQRRFRNTSSSSTTSTSGRSSSGGMSTAGSNPCDSRGRGFCSRSSRAFWRGLHQPVLSRRHRRHRRRDGAQNILGVLGLAVEQQRPEQRGYHSGEFLYRGRRQPLVEQRYPVLPRRGERHFFLQWRRYGRRQSVGHTRRCLG